MKLSRLAGAVDASTDNKLMQRVQQREREATPAGESILEIFERHASEQLGAGKRPDTVNGTRIVIEMFTGYVGNDRRLAAIGRDEIRDWRDAMAALPRNYRNSNEYKNLDMWAAVAKAAALKAGRIDPQTENSKISALSSIFNWAVSNGYADTNACNGLFVGVCKTGKIDVKVESDGLGSHAFRHTMADELRVTGFLDDQFGPLILGHHKGGVTGDYSRLAQRTAAMQCEMIDDVKFVGVNFDHLCDEAYATGADRPLLVGNHGVAAV
ncbi:hypothetical protein [Sphingomonas sp. 28-62-11]|uniref:hypothetical protein n=1 Tax=Sphingomonas sp. 28-62-11 TaxID=1970432 RepID=UPI000BD4E873|nr:MAG: hypothetical protein B7Y49_05630 [Sphingomonas sp. 28-62-11]